MTQPRRILPGATYLITRRCYQRTFRLRPCEQTTQIFLYCLALAAETTGVLVHGVCVMSNHHHLIVTDPNGVLPDFLRELHRSTAKALNAAQGQWENLWSAEHCHVETLADDSAVVESIAYVAANPVAAGLVDKPELWPGVSLWQPCTLHVSRPRVYFSSAGNCPENVTLRVAYPDQGQRRTDAGWARRIEVALQQRVVKAHVKMRKIGREFLGRAAVMAHSFAKRGLSWEPKREPLPTVAARDGGARRQFFAALKAFRRAYHEAVRSWRDGMRDVVFPFGTWWMSRHHAAAVAPPLAPA